MATEKKNRILDIFYRAMRGEKIKVSTLAGEYQVSEKSISRDIAEIKNYLADSLEQFAGVELVYDYADKAYRLEFDQFLLSKELFSVVKILIGCRGFSKEELLELVEKLRQFTTVDERQHLNQMIQNELYHYQEVRHDCASVIDNLWKLTSCINDQREITIRYFKMNRQQVERRIQPVAVMFSEYYFYLIAFRTDMEEKLPLYFRADRIVQIVEHRTTFVKENWHQFSEGELRKRIQFMQPGELRKIRFEFSGPSVQAILDKIPTAKVVGKNGKAHIIEAETYGKGINMFLLSQGHHVRALAPENFVEEMRTEIEQMLKQYQ
ncbi:MAG: WYL domain-containing protein [Lachnospiraceae bacterium]|nr:WYL domain-containing protein [Lachnospiraceae bacterium]